MIYDLGETILMDSLEQNDYEAFKLELLTSFTADCPFTEKEFGSGNKQEMVDRLFDWVYKNYRDKSARIAEHTYPIIREIYENNSRFQYIAIPITDGIKTMQVAPSLKKAYEDKGKEVLLAIEKGITLAVIDDAWKEHLREMDDLRQSVQSATYEQKDPLLIYKFESFSLFKTLVQRVNKEIVSFLMRANIPIQQSEQVHEAHKPQRSEQRLKEERTDVLSQRTSENSVTGPVRVEKKVGRNDPCPCGSGKKYKACHGKDEI